MSSGGGGQNTTSTVQNSNAYIPAWLEGYGQQAVQRADALSQQAYNPYTGQTVAGIDPAQQQAYNQIGALQGLGAGGYNTAIGAQQQLAGQATPLSAGGINANANTLQQGFNSNVYNPAQGLLGNYASQGPMTAQGVGQNAQQLMSPYTQSVIDPANRLMQQQLHQNLQTIGANANSAGAFGGSRQGVMEGVAQSQAALGSEKYLGDMLNQQWGNALTQGGSIAQYGAQQGLAANTALANLLQGGYAGNQKLGADIMNQNLTAGLNAAQQLPNTLTAQQAQMLGQTNALNQAGAGMQGYQQNILNSQQAAFAQQQAFPYQQLQTLLGAVSGIPYSTSNTGASADYASMYSNPWGQAIGGTAALGGLAGGVGSAINSYDNLGRND
jgi:hypothetical protein